MNLGLAIFLSSLFLGLIFLFHSTKDRWNWKKIIKYFSAILFSLILLFSAYYYFFSPTTKISYQKPYKATELWNIKLDEFKKDVIFSKGYPDQIDSAKSIWYYKRKHYLSSKEYYIYEQYEITFNKDKVTAVVYFFTERDYFFPPDLLGRTFNGYNLQSIKDYLGEQSNFSTSQDGLSRVYFFNKYNSLFYLRENRVFGYGIFNQKFETYKY